MPVRYDPLLTRGLAAELADRHAGRRTGELLLDRDGRLAALRFRRGPALVFVLHPEAGQIVESGRPPGETRLNLRGLRLVGVDAPADERLLVLDLPPDGDEGTAHRAVVELMTNQWNLVLLRRSDGGSGRARRAGPDAAPRDDPGAAGASWVVRDALWRREPGDRVLRPGAPYRPPAGGRRWARRLPGPDEWRGLLGDAEPGARRAAALRRVAWLSTLNVDWVLGDAAGPPDGGAEERDDGGGGADPSGGAGASGPDARPDADDALDAAFRRYRELRSADGRARLLEREWGLQPYTHRLGTEADELPSLLTGMARSLRAEGEWARAAGLGGEEGAPPRPVETPELAELRDALEARASRLRRRIEALERELDEGGDPGELREIANLLLARIDSVPRGEPEVELEGFGGEPREVELDPALSPSENADRYYEEAARRERARDKIPREIEDARRTLRRAEARGRALEEADEPPGEAEVEELWELAGGRPREEPGEPEEELPYRRLYTSGGLELRVGKGAKSNEELTFHRSHTEDIWLHARQVPGAHVILRWGRKEENPPRKDLIEAAVVAAVNSKARHSGTVGVDWTRRKYVRSPRKSDPGIVIPRNVQTLFVEPDEGLVERLERRAAGRR